MDGCIYVDFSCEVIEGSFEYDLYKLVSVDYFNCLYDYYGWLCYD